MKKLSRRDFIKKSAAAAFAGAFLPTIIPASALGKGGVLAPSERIVFGCIGVGSQMRGHRDFMRASEARRLLRFATSAGLTGKNQSALSRKFLRAAAILKTTRAAT